MRTGLRSEPATEEELDRIRFHRERGTSPGNPKWYKRSLLPRPLAYSMAQQYPARVRAMMASLTRVSPLRIPCGDDCQSTARYVAAFERLNLLLSATAKPSEQLRKAA